MITSKLSKDAKISNILVELSIYAEAPDVVTMFADNLRTEGIPMRREKIPPHQINFYLITQRKEIKLHELALSSVPSQFNHALSVLYMNDKT